MSFVSDSQFRNRQTSILVDDHDLKYRVVEYLWSEMLWFSFVGKVRPISIQKSEIIFDAKEFSLHLSKIKDLLTIVCKCGYTGNYELLETNQNQLFLVENG